jgi:hypothetical protein
MGLLASGSDFLGSLDVTKNFDGDLGKRVRKRGKRKDPDNVLSGPNFLNFPTCAQNTGHFIISLITILCTSNFRKLCSIFCGSIMATHYLDYFILCAR